MVGVDGLEEDGKLLVVVKLCLEVSQIFSDSIEVVVVVGGQVSGMKTPVGRVNYYLL